MLGDARIKPKKRWEWILWWRVDQDELQDQVDKYDTLGWFDAGRKLSVLCLLFSAALTTILAILKVVGADASVDIVAFLVLAFFIYRGHQWAMVVAMALWTLEKIATAFSGLGTFSANVASPVVSILWWGAYMHCFYLAYRVEQQRKNKPAPQIINQSETM